LLLYPGETVSEEGSELAVNTGSFNTNANPATPTISLTSALPSGMTATVTNIAPNDPGLGSPGVDVNFTVAPNLVGTSGILAFQATSGSSSGSMTREIDVPYSVVAAPELTQLLIPTTLTLPQGSTEDLYVALASTQQGTAQGTVVITGLPFGVTSTGNPGLFPSTVAEQLTAAPTTAVGQTPMTVTTTASGLTQTSQFTLNVVSIPNFTLTATPTTFDMAAGTTQTFTLEANAINGFTSDVSVTLTAVGNVTVTSPTTLMLTPGTPQQISVTAPNTSGEGAITVQATAGTLSQTLTVPVNVTPPGPNFSVTPNNITLGASTTGEFGVASIGGFVGTITEVLSGLPAGLLLAEGPNINDLYYSSDQPSMTLYATCGTQPVISNPYGGDCSAYTYVFDYNGVAAGTYPLTLTATYTPGGLQPEGAPTYPITYTYQLSLVVTPPTFPCSASPASLSIAPGSSQNITISATSLNGASDLFSYSGLPSGITANVYSSTVPSQPGGNYTTTYTLSAAANATAGSSVLTFTCQNQTSPSPGIGLNAYATETIQVPLVITP
jgi:hypothetical protein